MKSRSRRAAWWVATLGLLVKLVYLLDQVTAAPYAHEVFNNKNGLCSTFVHPYNYGCREFSVPTQDGFLLGVQRLYGPNRSKGPVFLYHGIMQGGDIWVINQPRDSLAFQLADAGYDVFLGNTRTSNFSYGHATLSRSDDDFWDWSWDNLVEQDLPTMLRFVHSQTNQRTMYVGFSQGTMTAFAAFAHSDVSGLVKKAAMLGPVAYLENVDAPMLSIASNMYLDRILLVAGVYEFRVENSGGRRVINTVCRSQRMQHVDCFDNLLDMVTGPNCCINTTRRPFYNRYEMQATSMKNVAHMAQLVRSGEFQKYDHGYVGNILHYGSLDPPSYSLSAFPRTVPLLLIRGEKDELADKDDVARLVKELPSETQLVVVPRYAHGDVMLGVDATALVYRKVIDFFAK
ncbi:triacylglycerol lipase 1-like [Selaginella moellendorffii]|uniref:triacylglycerol lipase 1-like n=1 Tax=Selaginella moellendorffii TaxID=88036 RepID=UPI000D1C9F09|nr:triacylglycerol lipase 1-like [Selaginella moellendorffii]|eukprot:XP_024522474.1 triacylglycerol lipase 1-like [Selaginella moellendorffii]